MKYILSIIGLGLIFSSCNQERQSAVNPTKAQKNDVAKSNQSNPSNSPDTTYSFSVINQLEGQWFHELDGNAAININNNNWTDIYYSGSTIESDSFNLIILKKLPPQYNTTVQADFIMLTNLTDTIYFELLGVSDSVISLMHYPTGKKHLYKKNLSPYVIELQGTLKNPNIDSYFKKIYYKERLIMHESANKMLSITDSLFSIDSKNDLFYFIVFTKSMNDSDGFYSEALGLSAYRFITTKTELFADYFNIAPKLTDKDMENWASLIYGEIQISSEGEELKAINELETRLLGNIKGARKEYIHWVEELIALIKKAHNMR